MTRTTPHFSDWAAPHEGGRTRPTGEHWDAMVAARQNWQPVVAPGAPAHHYPDLQQIGEWYHYEQRFGTEVATMAHAVAALDYADVPPTSGRIQGLLEASVVAAELRAADPERRMDWNSPEHRFLANWVLKQGLPVLDLTLLDASVIKRALQAATDQKLAECQAHEEAAEEAERQQSRQQARERLEKLRLEQQALQERLLAAEAAVEAPTEASTEATEPTEPTEPTEASTEPTEAVEADDEPSEQAHSETE